MNPLQCYAEVPTIAREVGYEMKTTFWGDFRVCGLDLDAIKDTYKRAFNGWKDDREYATELSMVLNWLSWYYAEMYEVEVAQLYVKLWQEIDGYILDNWKGENLSYYLRTTD